MENNLKKRLAAGEVSLCMGLRQSRTVDIGPLVGAAGFDSLYVDMEHSPIGFEATSAICIAAVAYGVTPLVRVPAHQAQDISRALAVSHRYLCLREGRIVLEGSSRTADREATR